MKTINIGVLVGSNRKGSYSKMLANNLINYFSDECKLYFIEIEQLPIYNQDFDSEGSPTAYLSYRDEIAAMDAFLIITPEYNRGLPALLKNALDIASRPYGQNLWFNKPVLSISLTMGTMGAYAAHNSLKETMNVLGMIPMNYPEVYLSQIHTYFDNKGQLIKEDTKDFLKDVILAYERWIKNFI